MCMLPKIIRRRIIPILFILGLFIYLPYYQYRSRTKMNLIVFDGQAMGTTYSIKYLSKDSTVLQIEIDSVLKDFNQALSTYVPDSEITSFNQKGGVKFDLPYFLPVLKRSMEIYKKSNGAFDPTIMPLVRAWGFTEKENTIPDSSKIDSILQYVGFNHVQYNEDSVWASKSGITLDMNAIAKGYGVDVIGNLLHSKGIENYMVEIGGEIACRGKNDQNQYWRITIDDPRAALLGKEIAILQVINSGIATSGNYRNYFEKDGKRYAHIINPATGRAELSDLLSSSVLAKDCMTADAWATAFMVMGAKEAINIAQQIDGLEAFFVFLDEENKLSIYKTPGMEKLI